MPPPRALVMIAALLFAAAIGYSVARVPVQVSDSLVEILEAQESPSIAHSFSGAFQWGETYFRPLRIAQIKAIFEASRGEYQLAYRGFHVLLVCALLWLFTRALRVASYRDVAIAVFALTVLTGLHTFLGLVRGAFPINHFLEIAVLCLAALNLSQSRGGWLVDAAAVLVFAAAALTLESGLLVWVVIGSAWMAGLRGISGRGLALVTLLLAAYIALRFDLLFATESFLAERASGFLLERLEPEVIEARFADRVLVYHAYNVGAALSSVLLSEPRDGLFVAVRGWRDGELFPRVYVALVSSAATTVLIGWWAYTRRSGPLTVADRVGIVAVIVCFANAVLSFGYAKDEVVSVAGVFYALAAYAAARALVQRVSGMRRAGVYVLAAAVLVVASAWTVRSVGVHHVLRLQAARVKGDWTRVESHLAQAGRWPPRPDNAAVIARLRQDALEARVPDPESLPEWNNRWFGD